MAATNIEVNQSVQTPRKAVTITVYGTSDNLSDYIYTNGWTLTEILIPSGWTTAAITFLKSTDNSTYYSYYDETGTEVSMASCVASTARRVKPEWFRGADWIRLRSGTVSGVTAQTTDKTLILIFRPGQA